VLTFFADDGRLFFIIPMGPKSCIGTTDTRTEKLPPEVTAEDRLFVLENINKRLDLEKPFALSDIIAERCGVRPLVINRTGKTRDSGDWTSLSRKHIIEVDSAKKHISIFGGKLTDCLNVGDEIIHEMQKLGFAIPFPDRQWFGEPPEQIRAEFFHQATLLELDRMTAPESSEALSSRLWRRYGTSALHLLEDIRQDPAMAEVLIKGTEYIRAEIHHAARREMIVKLEDFLRRRSKISLLEKRETIKQAPGLMEACRILFGDAAESRFNEYFQGV
jgi:glycerol-3-phosphate dehydrogenase